MLRYVRLVLKSSRIISCRLIIHSCSRLWCKRGDAFTADLFGENYPQWRSQVGHLVYDRIWCICK